MEPTNEPTPAALSVQPSAPAPAAVPPPQSPPTEAPPPGAPAPAPERVSPAVAEAPSTITKPPTPPPAHQAQEQPLPESNVEATVLAIIDDSGTEPSTRVPLRDLQRACVRVPHLSARLTGSRRYKLYVQLLLDRAHSIVPVPADVMAAVGVERVTEAHKELAARIVSLFPAGHFPSQRVVECFLDSFGSQSGFYFSPEHSNVFATMASIVAQGELSNGEESLRMLNSFMAVVAKDYLPSNSSRLYDGAARMLFRLLLQYHDPALCTHLDQHKVDVGGILALLTRSLFILRDDIDAALCVLDWVFILGDPVLVPYVAIAVLMTARQKLLSIADSAALTAAVDNLSVRLPNDRARATDPKLADGRSVALVPVWSGKSLCQNADLTFRSTPHSAQRVLEFCLYPESGSINKTPKALEEYYAAAPCLPLERSDIASSFGSQPNPLTPVTLQYVMVDCRSQGSFDYARLPTAVLVGDVLSYDAEALSGLVDRLRPSRGCHLSFFGTGRALTEEVNLLKVAALHLVRAGFPFVSITAGGFRGVIPLIRARSIHVVRGNGEPFADAGGHSLFASLPSRLTALRDAYLPADAEAVRARATELGDELRDKAKGGLTVASEWGWGLVQRAQEKLAQAREAASTAMASRTTTDANSNTTASHAGGSSAAATAASSSRANVATTPTASTSAVAHASDSAAPLHVHVAPTRPPAQIFTLDDEDGEGEEEDLGLITTVPTHPMRGTRMGGGVGEGDDTVSSGVAPAAAAAAVPAAASAGTTETTPSVAHSPPPTTAPAAATAPETVEGREPSATVATITASIDKEFEDLFGS